MDVDGPRILRAAIAIAEVRRLADLRFGDMIKATVDVSRAVIALGGELHSDQEAMLIDDGSQQLDLWGINLYPGESSETWIEFDSMINVRPGHGNRSRGVDSAVTQAAIRDVVAALVSR